MDVKITEALNSLKTDIKSKTADEIKSAIDAIEAKHKTELETATKAVKDEFKTIQEELEGKIKAAQDHADKLDIKLKQNQGEKKATILTELKGKKEAIRGLAKRTSFTEVEIKANTTRASIGNNAQAVELNDIGQLATRKLSMYDAFNKIPVGGSNHNGTIRYYDWNEETIDREAEMTAEGEQFPESKAGWQTYTIDLKKVGDTLPITEEFFEDEAMFAAEINQFLLTNVNLKIDDQLANGPGTGNNLKGLVASVNAFTAVASGIADASIYDLICKVKESITATGGAKYNPNVVFMNISDINKMKLKKDANNNYVIPPFVDRNGQVVDGITVIESNVIAANTLVLGDNRYARIYEKSGLTLSQGTVDSQFTADMETLKIRKRLLFLIRNADKGAWKKVTSISTDLTTLAST
jgi:HK97 family phage major capsid protein